MHGWTQIHMKSTDWHKKVRIANVKFFPLVGSNVLVFLIYCALYREVVCLWK